MHDRPLPGTTRPVARNIYPLDRHTCCTSIPIGTLLTYLRYLSLLVARAETGLDADRHRRNAIWGSSRGPSHPDAARLGPFCHDTDAGRVRTHWPTIKCMEAVDIFEEDEAAWRGSVEEDREASAYPCTSLPGGLCYMTGSRYMPKVGRYLVLHSVLYFIEVVYI